jgi:hypothetical protein
MSAKQKYKLVAIYYLIVGVIFAYLLLTRAWSGGPCGPTAGLLFLMALPVVTTFMVLGSLGITLIKKTGNFRFVFIHLTALAIWILILFNN